MTRSQRRGVRLAAGLALLAAGVRPQESRPAGTDERLRSWRVHGRVVDETGKPLAGACLLLGVDGRSTTQEALTAPTTRTGADGRFELACTADRDDANRQMLVLAAPGRAGATVPHLPATGWEHSRRDERVDLGDVVLPAGATIKGRVRTANGRPIAGVRVVAYDPWLDPFQHSWDWEQSTRRQPSFTIFATSDADGAFELTGVMPVGARVVARADGYHTAELPFVNAAGSLLVEMQPGGFVEGVVQDAAGKPCRAYVAVQYEAGSTDRSAESGPDGTFRVNLEFPHRYHLRAWEILEDDAYSQVPAQSAVLDGPARGIVLRPPQPATDGPRLAVRVVDAVTEQPIAGARVAAFWVDPEFLEHEDHLAHRFAANAGKTSAAGEALLAPPGEGEPEVGAVMAKAKGYAPFLLKDVNWSADTPPKPVIRLAPEARISGRVVDEQDRPIEGALVGTTRTIERHFAPYVPAAGGATARTGPDGTFTLGGLPAGKHRLRARHPERPDSAAQLYEVAAGAERKDVRFVLAAGARLSGKLTEVRPDPGWCVILRAQPTGVNFGPDARPGSRARVDAGGRFEFTGLAAGNYDLLLSVPHRHGRGGQLEMPLEPLRIRKTDVTRDFDASDCVPGRIRGKVEFTGAPVPFERLLVRATGAPPERFGWFGGGLRPVVSDVVAADGTFSLPCVAGVQRVEVVDLATRIPLASVEEVEVAAGATAVVKLAEQLATLRVELQPEKEGDPVVAERIEVLLEQGEGEERAARPWESEPTHGGIALSGVRREVELVVPARPLRLRVHSNAEGVVSDQGHGESVLAEVEVTPAKGEPSRVTIPVPRK